MQIRLIALIFFVFSAATAHAQFFFVAPAVEAVFYGRQAPAIVYGGVIGIGDSVTVGLRVLYGQSLENERQTTSFEATMFGRVYFPDFDGAKGFFAQLNYGFVLFSPDGTVTTPSAHGSLSASLGVGWRFVIGRVFIEPFARGGWPYLYGGGLTAGLRF